MTREAAATPPRPDPWATTAPREAMRDSNAARVVSLSPSVNLTPIGNVMVPVPYNVVDFAGHDDGYTPTVRFTSQRAMVLRSRTEHVHGDAAGTGGGVASGTVGGITEPIGHAAQVRAEGSHVIRHLDRFWMNNRNTVGEAQFVRDTGVYPAPPDTDPIPGSARTVMSGVGPEPDMSQSEVQLALLEQQVRYTTPRAPTILRAPPTPRAPITPPAPTTRPSPVTPARPPAPARPQPPSGTGLWGRFLFLLGMGEVGHELGDQAGRAFVGPDGVRGKELSDALTGSVPSLFSPQGNQIGEALREGGMGSIDGTNTLLSLKAGRLLDFRTMPQEELDRLLRQPWPSAEQLARNRQVLREQRAERARREHERAAPVPLAPDPQGNARVSSTPTEREREDCGIRRHSVNQTRCAANGGASHHGMVDFPFRTGTQRQTVAGTDHRAPGVPKYMDAYTICVPASQDDGADELNEHRELHSRLNDAIRDTGVQGTTTFGDVRRLSFAEIDNLSPETLSTACKEIYKRVLTHQYSMPGNLMLRASPYRPLPSKDNPVGQALSRAWNFTW